MPDSASSPLQHRPRPPRRRASSVASSQPYADQQRQIRPMPSARLTVEQELTKFIGQKFAFVMLGFSGLGYEHVETLEQTFRQDLAQTIHDKGGAQNVIVVGGATEAGVGRLYEIAKQMGVATLGIVSEAARQYQEPISPSCDHTIYVPDPGGTWDVLSPSGKSYTVIAGRTNVLFGGPGGELFSYGGGEVAGREIMEADHEGVPFTLYPGMRPEAGKAEAKQLAHDKKQAQRPEQDRVPFDATPMATQFGHLAGADGRYRSSR